MRVQRLLGPGRDLEPGDREVAGAEFARVHQDVGAEPVPLLDWGFCEPPDEHGGFLPDTGRRPVTALANDEVDELAGHDDLLDDLLAVEVAADLLAAARQLQQLVLGGVGRRLDPVAQLAVDLDDEGEGVGCQQRRVGLGPGLLPDPLALSRS